MILHGPIMPAQICTQAAVWFMAHWSACCSTKLCSGRPPRAPGGSASLIWLAQHAFQQGAEGRPGAGAGQCRGVPVLVQQQRAQLPQAAQRASISAIMLCCAPGMRTSNVQCGEAPRLLLSRSSERNCRRPLNAPGSSARPFWRASSSCSAPHAARSAGSAASLFWRTARPRRLVSCDTPAGSAVSALPLRSSRWSLPKLQISGGSVSSLRTGSCCQVGDTEQSLFWQTPRSRLLVSWDTPASSTASALPLRSRRGTLLQTSSGGVSSLSMKSGFQRGHIQAVVAHGRPAVSSASTARLISSC